MWSLRVSVKGEARVVEISSEAKVSDLATAVQRLFKLQGDVTIAGGFPPKALALNTVLDQVVRDKELLRAIETKAEAPEYENKKITTSSPRCKPSTKKKKRDEKEEDTKKGRKQVKFDTAEALVDAAGSGSKKKSSIFFRAALKGELNSRHEESKANDRYAASISFDFCIREKIERLDGQVSGFDVDFPETSGGVRSRKRHQDSVDALGRNELIGVILEALKNGDADMLLPPAMARCSPRCFWSLLYHCPPTSTDAQVTDGINAALQILLPTIDWNQVNKLGAEYRLPAEIAAINPQDSSQETSQAERRAARAAAAEARFGVVQSPIQLNTTTETQDKVIDDALLSCVQDDRSALDLLRLANIATPRDLAHWRQCPDILRDIIQDNLSNTDITIALPDTSTLGSWANAAALLLHNQPELQDFVARPRLLPSSS
mmetsp:Transcript_11635/g.15816  ORF Transcript_11635/g.15816 Transcript_11635/m.15816 type:complete len:433 (-) Transcript_11635:192-1490(-)|eukprot:CAMPEP_0197305752 /NCGR_PEP_ID=MMETSP0891-20130614/2107_1 /TAXON_ID=44058 ORGANISM="Aureoumbra lagunensis, Strain CCMP1510" /NCGR_SAMPLE_ID=MMETSP0891 /ASSEMBLY_ACC=CAM_ASM_000534 /LENGTH=432 /DNA_ID=CAMNT_0042787199 /DNA_START=18 /DNA_END=1316 /DNA_ORIENTATION=-